MSQDYRRRGRRQRPRFCAFCADKDAQINYKQPRDLRRYMSGRGKMRPRRQTGLCAKHQRKMAQAVKRARHLALLSFAGEGRE